MPIISLVYCHSTRRVGALGLGESDRHQTWHIPRVRLGQFRTICALALFGYAFMAMGLYALAAGLLDWDFFMNHRKAQHLVSLVGRQAARVVYAVLGSALLTLGVLLAAGVIRETSSLR